MGATTCIAIRLDREFGSAGWPPSSVPGPYSARCSGAKQASFSSRCSAARRESFASSSQLFERLLRDGSPKRHPDRAGSAYTEPPSRHEADELVAATTAAALESDVLAMCNPYPGDALPLEVYGDLVCRRARQRHARCSSTSPRRGSTARSSGEPDLVKLNDWELAEYVTGPVETAGSRAARPSGCASGRRDVLVTRAGDPALVLLGETPSSSFRPRSSAAPARAAATR